MLNSSLDKKEKLSIDFICTEVVLYSGKMLQIKADSTKNIIQFMEVVNLRSSQIFSFVLLHENIITFNFKYTFNNRSNKEVDIKEGDEFHIFKNAK